MPKVTGALGTVRNFMSIVKEVDFDEVRGRAETPPSILVCASDEGLAGSFVRQVVGEDAERRVDTRTQWFGDIDGSKYDIVVALDPGSQDIAGQVRQAISVMKKRTGNHERTIRELRLANGIVIGEPVREFQEC